MCRVSGANPEGALIHKRGARHRNEPRVRSNSSVIVNSLRAPNQSDDAALPGNAGQLARSFVRRPRPSPRSQASRFKPFLTHAHQSGSGSSCS